MTGGEWFRFLRQNSGALALPGAVARAAVREETTDRMLELAARSLLQVGPAERAAVWLEDPHTPEIYFGTVAEASSKPVPEAWRRLDVSVPFYKTILQSEGPVVAELSEFSGVSMIGPLAGMRAAAWYALRVQKRTLGLALVAYADPPQSVETDLLQLLADVLGLAVARRRDRELYERQQVELAAWRKLQRAILRGTPPKQVLPRIVSEAKRHTGAEFVALGRPGAGSLAFEFVEGSQEWLAWMQEEPVAKVYRMALEEGRTVEAGWETLRSGLPHRDLLHSERVSRVWAHPLEARGRKLGVLVAGLAPRSEAAGETERLESYGILVAAALAEESAPASAPEESRRADAELRALLDSVACGVLLFDATGQVRFANERLAQLLGLSLHRLAELDKFDALVSAISGYFRDPHAFAARWRELLHLRHATGWDELELMRPTRKLIERFARPVRGAGGERLGWLEVYRDITSERLIHSKLLQTEKMAALGHLVSGIAHELNNPLTSIMGYAQLLLGRRLGPEAGADAHRIYQEADRAGRIVKNLLLFARETKPERRAVNLNEVVERTVALRSYELKVENIAVEFELDADLPPTLADTNQMQQVVLNLVVNAEQAIQQGRGRGRIRIRTQALSAERLVLEVTDDGPGMPPETVSRIFDPFFTTKPVGQGTGLGLSIVYGIVRAHGGEISVESHLGERTTFLVELPIFTQPADLKQGELSHEPVEELALEPAPLATEPAGDPAPVVPAQGERVLVVEDEPTVAQLIADVLREDGHRVDTVLDSREGLERLGRRNYDLVICDLKMPHLDGRALYRSLVRAGSPLQHRIVFVTGDTLTPRTLEFLNSNGLPYLAKPFLVEELRLAVQRAFGSSGAHAHVTAAGASAGDSGDAVRRT